MAPRKMRLAADLLRGKKINEAERQLKFLDKKAAAPLLKLLKSAVANAKNNFKIKDEEKLYIKNITVNMAPTLKRYMPRAFGRTAPIRKRASHINIILSQYE